MRNRLVRLRGDGALPRYALRWDVREADLFWTDLVGGLGTRAPVLEDEGYVSMPAEAVPAGQTASPCDIAKTSETLDRFALDSSKLTAAHRKTIGTLADCLLALGGGSRPIRTVDIVGFTDPTGPTSFKDRKSTRLNHLGISYAV